ncbi:DMT family transporter [Rubrobacter xylanophilus]|nr:DMT family transporter [Rubrobacter xylanophilus]
MGELLAILALTMFSTNIILTKVASAKVAVGLGFLVAVIVNVLFASLLMAVQVAVRQEPLQVDLSALLLFALAGFFSTYLGRWFFYDSVVRLGPSRASAFQASNPMFTVLIAWLVLGETLTRTDVAAAAAILLGLSLASYRPPERGSGSPGRPFEKASGKEKTRSTLSHGVRLIVRSGVFLALFGALSYAVSNVLRGLAIRDWNEPVLGVLVGAVTGLVASLLLSSEARGFLSKLRRADHRSLHLYVISGILTVLAQGCMIAAMRYSPVSIVTLITLSTPVLVTPLGYFLLQNRERLVPRTVLGSILVLSGIAAILLT